MLSDSIAEYKRQNLDYKLPVMLGTDSSGQQKFADLSDLKHIVLAGQTGSGKSMFEHAVINTLLTLMPDGVEFVLADMKRVEFPSYNGIPQLMSKIFTEQEEFMTMLEKLIEEKNMRLQSGKDDYPYIVVIIDSISDLVVYDQKRLENLFSILLDGADKAKIHLLFSDSRVGPAVFTPKIMSLFPTKICFATADVDGSKLVIGSDLGPTLSGRGDALLLKQGTVQPIRLQTPSVSDEDIKKLIDDQSVPRVKDTLFNETVDLVKKSGTVSWPKIKRRFKVGYARARRLIDELEKAGVLGPSKSDSEPGKVLIGHGNDESVWKNPGNM